MTTTTVGVPQGSILCPILFLIYVNDISSSAQNLNVIHFADDTTVVTSGCNEYELYNSVKKGLTSIDKWLKANRLSLNVKKTKFKITTDQQIAYNLRFKMRNRGIEHNNKIKFLGVMLDSSLSFGNHISYITGKISRSVGMVARVSHMVPFSQLLNIYYSIIYSHLSYCVPVWGRASATVEFGMQRLQIRAIRVITRCAVNTQPQIRKLLTFNSIYKYFTSVNLFSLLKEGKHEYFHNRVASFQIYRRHLTIFKVNPNNLAIKFS